MAQVLKLKRTAVQGKSPTTDTLELGELAINTYDGKLYFEKDNGVPSIQSIVVTDALISGSLNIGGAVTASYFIGNGSGLTNLPNADVSQVATITASFDNTSSFAVTHNFNSKNIIVSVYGTNDSQIIPSSVILTNNNTTTIGLSSPQSGYAVVAKGGHIVSGTIVQEVATIATVTASFDTQSTISVTHNFNSKNLVISVYNSNDSQIIPSSVTLTDLNTATIGLSSAQSGYVVVAKGGHLVTAVGTVSYNTLTDIPSGIVSSSVTTPAGTISGSSQLTASFDTRYTLSGSISAVPIGTISGSSQLTASVLATTGSNTFRGTQIHSGSIIPAIDNTYDLGSLEYQWRDIFVSSGSLYIDGTKVLGSTGTELQITTDNGQSIKILEAGTDNIILQSADGDIELKSSGGGDILLDPTAGLISVKGTLQIQDGNKITSSGANSIIFGDNIIVSGSIESVGTINGINLNTFSSSIASTFLNQNTATSSYEIKGSGIVSGSSQVISLLPTGVVSGSLQTIANLPTGVISGSSQIVGGSGLLSGSSQVDVMSTTNITRLATTGSNTFFGLQTFSGSVYIANDLIVQGSSSIQYISASSVSIGTNIVQLNTANPSVRYAGLSIIDSGSIGGSGSFLYDSVQDEFIFVHRGNGTNVTSSHFLLGPETYDDLGNETYLTTNKLPKGTGKEHLNDSNITDTGTLITLGSNTSVTGILTATGFSGSLASTNGVVSGSSQIVGILTDLNTFSGSQNTKDLTLATYTSSLDTKNTTLATYTSSLDTKNSTLATYTASVSSQLSNLNTATSSYETKGRSIVSGSSQITFNGISSLPTLVSGSSQITLSSTTGYGSVINQAVLTTSTPTFAGATFSGNVLPEANGTRDLGSAALRWSTVYTSDLSLNNGIGDWTIVEGEDDLFLYNNKKGKVYKFALTEVDPNVATPKKS
jgi:hypothetical protein